MLSEPPADYALRKQPPSVRERGPSYFYIRAKVNAYVHSTSRNVRT